MLVYGRRILKSSTYVWPFALDWAGWRRGVWSFTVTFCNRNEEIAYCVWLWGQELDWNNSSEINRIVLACVDPVFTPHWSIIIVGVITVINNYSVIRLHERVSNIYAVFFQACQFCSPRVESCCLLHRTVKIGLPILHSSVADCLQTVLCAYSFICLQPSVWCGSGGH